MRFALLLTCLMLTAWTEPAGTSIMPALADIDPGVSIVDKTVGAAPSDADDWTGPAETSEQLTRFDDFSALAPAAQKFESGDALASLDAVADGFGGPPAEFSPCPPHRAVPHAQVCEALADAAANNDLPAPFFIRLIWQESGFKQNVVSPAGAQGVAQFMPETAARRGLDDPFNPLQAVRASAQLLRDLFQQFGNLGLAAAAYNAGPRRVQDWLAKKSKLPQETRDYVERITGKKAEEWKAKSATAVPLRVPARAPCQREAGLYAANGPGHVPLPPGQPHAQPTVTVAAKAAPTKHAATRSGTASQKVASHGKAGKGHGKKVKVADAEPRQ